MYKLFKSAFLLLTFLFLSGCDGNKEPKFVNVLVFSKTAGYRHDSIKDGIEAIQKMAAEQNFQVTFTEDAKVFNPKSLAAYNVILFLSTTGNILNESQQHEFQRWIQAGGGFVGIHAATDTEYEWPWYNELVGGYFSNHPPGVHEATIEVKDTEHISTKHLGQSFKAVDEWYNFKDIYPKVIPILNLDEDSYQGGDMGKNHPIAWYHEFDGGRSWYTGMGHTKESFSDDRFLKHIMGGILYAAGNQKAVDYSLSTVAPEENRFEKIVLKSNLNEPVELDFLPDGRIIWVERAGRIYVYDPDSNSDHLVQHLDINYLTENGLIGLAVDPNYENNKFIYLHYSAPDKNIQRLSRFEFDPDAVFELKNEKEILSLEVQIKECCHTGGSLLFGKGREFFMSTGDNTNPFESDGFGPIDDRPGREPFDARGTSANSMDLRGKILKIIINEDGSYDIPEGNLFSDPKEGRPEIYVMGCRNPYRISYDPHNDFVYWGDIGPDAPDPSDTRGPAGHDEVNQARKAGFFGWPLFVGNNKAYHDYDFATKKSGKIFDPKNPINDSRNNTGIVNLPPAQPAMIYYPYGKSSEFPLMGSGARNAMAGPIFNKEDYPESDNRLPAYYDKKFLSYDWMRNKIYSNTLNEEGDLVRMEPFLPSMEFANLIELELDKNGEIYLLEYGLGWFSQNQDARLVHLKYRGGNRPPIAKIKVAKKYGASPFNVQASADASLDYDDDKLGFEWYNNGRLIGKGSSLSYTFEYPGEQKIKLKVTDEKGQSSIANTTIFVGNTEPEIAINITGNQSFFWDNRQLDYSVSINDLEDGQLGNGVLPTSVTTTIDYLSEGFDENIIALGHRDKVFATAGERLIDELNCLSCHKIEGYSAGPSYTKVAERYPTDSPIKVSYLAKKIINGGSGVWGEKAMPANPSLSEKDAGDIVKYILSLNNPPSQKGLATKGNYVLDKHINTKKDGRYILKSSYIDRGGEFVGPLKTSTQLYLRHYQLSIVHRDFDDKGERIKLDKELFPRVKDQHQVLDLMSAGHVGFNQIDLTEIAAVQVEFYTKNAEIPEGILSIKADGKIIGISDPTKFKDNGNGGYSIKISISEYNSLADVSLSYQHPQWNHSIAIHRLDFLTKDQSNKQLSMN